MSQTAYAVRSGFVYVDESGATPRTYVAGESVLLDAAGGDAAHQLERMAAPARKQRVVDTQAATQGELAP